MEISELEMIEMPVSSLNGYDKNPRKNDAVVDCMVESIKEFGFRIPVVAKSDGSVIDGHLRLKAAQRMGMKSVPVVLADELTDAQVKAFRLLANRSANWADWDEDLLRQELADLKDMDFDLSLTGFDADEISSMLDLPLDVGGLTDPDEVPEPPVVTVTKPGDVWLLGKHRLMCGDSTSIDAVEKLMAGQKAQFCFTSPPYNSAAKFDSIHSKAKRCGGKGFYADGYSDDRSSDEYIQFNADIISAMEAVAADDFTCCHNINYNKNSPSEYIDIIAAAKRSIPLVETIVWEKAMAVSLQGDNLTRIYEFIFVLAKGRFKINKGRTECLRNLWKISNIGANHEKHKACFPIALVEEGIKNFCPHGGTIIEPFGGTGTTAIAAEKLGCKSHVMEIDPKYCDVIVKRWEDFTGKKAVLESDGVAFNAASTE